MRFHCKQGIRLFLLSLIGILVSNILNAQSIDPAIREKLHTLKVEREALLNQKNYTEAVRLTWQLAQTHQDIGLDGVAVQLLEDAILEAKNTSDQKLVAAAYARLGDYYPELKYYNKAKENYDRAMSIYKQVNDLDTYGKLLRKLADISYKTHDYTETEKYLTLLLDEAEKIQLSSEEEEQILKRLIKVHNKQNSPNKVKLYEVLLKDLKLIRSGKKDAGELKKSYQDYKQIDPGLLSKEEEERWLERVAHLEKQLVKTEKKSAEKDLQISKQQEEIIKKEEELLKKKQEIFEKEKKLFEQDKINERNRSLLLIGGTVVLLVLLSTISIILVIRRSNKALQLKNLEIEQEQQKSEELLLNILPADTAKELLDHGKAKPRLYEKVSVLFTDFKGFTQMSEKLSPEEIVEDLNICFSAFDRIVVQHGLEKIKTIGDAYMCAGGIPTANDSNPIATVRAALEMQKFIENWKKERMSQNRPSFEIRLGIHTGPVVSGVVGVKKFAYDIWGDTVNVASRMESSGEVGHVNISGSTYEYVKEVMICEYRGKVPAKNKGEVDMYFVKGEKNENEIKMAII